MTMSIDEALTGKVVYRYMHYVSMCHSDIGISKNTNQDAIALLHAKRGQEETVMAVICDGLGGLAYGEWASAIVSSTFHDWFCGRIAQLWDLTNPEVIIYEEWGEMIQQLHRAMKQISERQHVQAGTTLEVLLLLNGQYYLCHVGDCRTYTLTEELCQLTADHSVVQQEVEAGRLTETQALHDSRQSMLWQCVGAGRNVRPDFLTGSIVAGQGFLLCSDGFRRQVSEPEMGRYGLRSNIREKKMKSVLKKITNHCKKRGETDNISSILICEREIDGGLQTSSLHGIRNYQSFSDTIMVKDILLKHSSPDKAFDMALTLGAQKVGGNNHGN